MAATTESTDQAAGATADPAQGRATPTDQTQLPPVDVKAAIDAAVTAARAEFSKEFSEATGFKTPQAFKAEKLKAEGKTDELLTAVSVERDRYKADYGQLLAKVAILEHAQNAVDTGTVLDLLLLRAAVDDAGTVTIDGKPVQTAEQ